MQDASGSSPVKYHFHGIYPGSDSTGLTFLLLYISAFMLGEWRKKKEIKRCPGRKCQAVPVALIEVQSTKVRPLC